MYHERVPFLDSAQRGIDYPHKRRPYPDLPPDLGPWPRDEPLNQASLLIPAVRCRTQALNNMRFHLQFIPDSSLDALMSWSVPDPGGITQ
jgi:hypothetical protein